jgi:hypothetical protein
MGLRLASTPERSVRQRQKLACKFYGDEVVKVNID